MGRRGAAERKHIHLGLPSVKPGKVGWVHGTKLEFFASHKDEFLSAAEIKETGRFYSDLAQAYLAKYGYNTPWDSDLEEGQDIADDVDPDEDVNDLPADEGEERAEYFKKLQGKIGVWYNTQYGSAIKKKPQKLSFREVFDKPELNPEPPVKTHLLHYYSHHFYDERIKPRFVARWAVMSRLEEPPAAVYLRNLVTRECWDGETEAFKAEVLVACETDHKRARDAYEIALSGEIPATPEEYNVALNNAAYYLQPFVDAAGERFGVNVSLLMCGPVAERRGRIEMWSIHSGKLNGLVPRIWADYDCAGFDATQQSFIDFSHQCFTEAECRARSLNGMPIAEEDGPNHVPPNVVASPAAAPLQGPPPATNGAPPSLTTAPAAAPAAPVVQSPVLLQGSLPLIGTDGVPFGLIDFDTPLDIYGLGPNFEDLLLPNWGGMGFPASESIFGLGGAPSVATGSDVDHLWINTRNIEELDEEEARARIQPAYRGTGQAVQQQPDGKGNGRHKEGQGGGDDEEETEGGEMWEEEDTSDWQAELQNTFGGFARGESWGGEGWRRCVTKLIALEKAWGFPNKGLLAVPNSADKRPSEVAIFMRYGRKWGLAMELASAIGPRSVKESFAGRWWNWWGRTPVCLLCHSALPAHRSPLVGRIFFRFRSGPAAMADTV
ncbi:hypothetical protein B0H19DRAFT_1245892 [Mycena capillaripes]|nr:hypothetical protein B0H19DRAFT_1245892 [Mycena capillaripes]